MSCSAWTCARRAEDLEANLFEQLKIRAKTFDCYSFAMDESNDITDTAQLLLIRGIDATFTVHEELCSLCSLKGATTGEELFLKEQENTLFFGTELGKVEKCNNRWWEKHVRF
jgi:hypothetical protein